jgi:archaellum component FlaC
METSQESVPAGPPPLSADASVSISPSVKAPSVPTSSDNLLSTSVVPGAVAAASAVPLASEASTAPSSSKSSAGIILKGGNLYYNESSVSGAKKGFLRSGGTGNANWKSRYVKVSLTVDGRVILAVHKVKDDGVRSAPHETMFIKANVVVSMLEGNASGFSVLGGEELFMFNAQTQTVREEWVRVIEKGIEIDRKVTSISDPERRKAYVLSILDKFLAVGAPTIDLASTLAAGTVAAASPEKSFYFRTMSFRIKGPVSADSGQPTSKISPKRYQSAKGTSASEGHGTFKSAPRPLSHTSFFDSGSAKSTTHLSLNTESVDSVTEVVINSPMNLNSPSPSVDLDPPSPVQTFKIASSESINNLLQEPKSPGTSEAELVSSSPTKEFGVPSIPFPRTESHCARDSTSSGRPSLKGVHSRRGMGIGKGLSMNTQVGDSAVIHVPGSGSSTEKITFHNYDSMRFSSESFVKDADDQPLLYTPVRTENQLFKGSSEKKSSLRVPFIENRMMPTASKHVAFEEKIRFEQSSAVSVATNGSVAFTDAGNYGHGNANQRSPEELQFKMWKHEIEALSSMNDQLNTILEEMSSKAEALQCQNKDLITQVDDLSVLLKNSSETLKYTQEKLYETSLHYQRTQETLVKDELKIRELVQFVKVHSGCCLDANSTLQKPNVKFSFAVQELLNNSNRIGNNNGSSVLLESSTVSLEDDPKLKLELCSIGVNTDLTLPVGELLNAFNLEVHNINRLQAQQQRHASEGSQRHVIGRPGALMSNHTLSESHNSLNSTIIRDEEHDDDASFMLWNPTLHQQQQVYTTHQVELIFAELSHSSLAKDNIIASMAADAEKQSLTYQSSLQAKDTELAHIAALNETLHLQLQQLIAQRGDWERFLRQSKTDETPHTSIQQHQTRVELVDQLHAALAKADYFETLNDQYAGNLERLETEKIRLDSTVKSFKKQAGDLQAEVEDLRRQVDMTTTLKSSVSRLNEELSSLRYDFQNSQRQHDMLVSELATSQSSKMEAEQELQLIQQAVFDKELIHKLELEQRRQMCVDLEGQLSAAVRLPVFSVVIGI